MYVWTYGRMDVCTYVRTHTYVRTYVCTCFFLLLCVCECACGSFWVSLPVSSYGFPIFNHLLNISQISLAQLSIVSSANTDIESGKAVPSCFLHPRKNRSGLHVDVIIILYYIYIHLSFIYLYAPLMKSRKFWLLCCPKAPAFGMKRPTSLCSRGNDFGEGVIENKKDMLVSKLVGMKILQPGTSLIINMYAKKIKKEHEMILIDIGHMRNPCADKDDECQGRSWNIWHCSPIDSDRNWTGFSVSLGRPEPAQSIFKPKRSTSLDRTQFTILCWSTCSWL